MKYFFISFFTALLALVSFNYWVDPTGDFHDMNQIPVPKGSVYLGMNIDERLLKKKMLQADHDSDSFILGTSRVMGWNPTLFPQDTMLNLGVGMGTVDDYFWFLDQFAKRPNLKHLVIEIAPWTFHQAKSWDRSPIFYHDKSFQERLSDFKNLFSYPILHESIMTIVRNQPIGGAAPEKGSENKWGYFPDGRRHYPSSYYETGLETVRKKILKWTQVTPIPDFESGISDELVNRFCASIKTLRDEHHARIDLVSLPWNPFAESELIKRGYDIRKLQEVLNQRVAQTCGQKVIALAGLCPESDFIDGEHFLDSCFRASTNAIERAKTAESN